MAEDQHIDHTPEEGDYELDREVLRPVLAAVDAGDAAALTRLLEPLHAADIADLLEQVDEETRAEIVRLYGHEFDGEILSELDESIREDVIGALEPEVLAEAVRELETDDVVDLIEDLEAPQQEAILGALEAGDRVAVEQSLTYPEETAGRLMQRELVVAPEHWNVGEAIDYLRIMSSPRSAKLAEIAEESFRTIPVLQDEGEVAYAFHQYHLISAPVVDADDRLVGVITIDDAMGILDEEHEEDIMRLAGVGEGSLADNVFETTKRRVPWLVVNLITAGLAAFVISLFEDTIASPVAHRGGAGAGDQGPHQRQRLAGDPARGPGGAPERAGAGGAAGAPGGRDLRLLDPGRGDRRGADHQPLHRRLRRHHRADPAGEDGSRPGAGVRGLRHHPHRRGRLLCLPRARRGDAAMSLAEVKAAARAAAMARRATAHGHGRDAAAQERLALALEPYRGRPIAGYMPIRTEVNPLPVMAALAAEGPVGVPVIEAAGTALSFRRWTPGCALVPGRFGAPVPMAQEALVPEVLIVPLLAFDRAGNRLGYGGGFYDRTLEALRAARPETVAIGFAYAAQEAEALPLEPTDQRLDAIVTDAFTLTFER
jgi:magnesium transporter